MAEIRRPRVAGGGERSRGCELEIHRAVTAARNPRESKFGECLLNVHTKQDAQLKRRLGRIGTEMRRMEYRMHQLKQHFVKNNPCLNHEPLILVERPASPQVRHRAKVIEVYGEDPENLKLPGYMRPRRSQCKTPSTLTTIDAFTLKTKKKRNVWEEAMDEKEPPRFRSTVRPSAKLTQHEMAALHLGWDAHKPRIDLDLPKEKNKPASAPAREATADTPFLTQLPRKELPQTPDGRLLKSVVLDQIALTSPIPNSVLNPKSEADRKRKVAIIDKPFFITQRSSQSRGNVS
ncbi:hypothetical protein ACOMHN_018797 [Nucella lapillus]